MGPDRTNWRFWHAATLAGAVDAGFLRAHTDVLVDSVRASRYQDHEDLAAPVVAVAVALALATGRRTLPDRSETGLDLARMIASQPALAGEQMHALLSRFRDAELRRKLAANPATPATVLSRLLRLSPMSESDIAMHPNLSAPLAARLWAGPLSIYVAERNAILAAWRDAAPSTLRRLRRLADPSVTSAQAVSLMWPVVAGLADRDLLHAVSARIDELSSFERERSVTRWLKAASAHTDPVVVCALARMALDTASTFADAVAGPAGPRELVGLLCEPDRSPVSTFSLHSTDRVALVGALLDVHPHLVHDALPMATGPSLVPLLPRLGPDLVARIADDSSRPPADRQRAARHLATHLAARPELARVIHKVLTECPGDTPAELDCWEAVAAVLGPDCVLDAPARLFTSFRSAACQQAIFERMSSCGQTALLFELSVDFPGSISDLLASVHVAAGE